MKQKLPRKFGSVFCAARSVERVWIANLYDTFVARKHGPVPSLTYKVLRGIEGKADLSSPELKDFDSPFDINETLYGIEPCD